MKSPDEIKRGLECCVDGNIVCAGNCVFDDDVKSGYPDCVKLLMTNALALIQQLEAQNAQQARCIENMTDKLNAMNDEAAKLQAENAQLLRDVHGKCGACKWMYADGFERVCDPCLSKIKDNFEWRGVQKEGSDDGKE